MKFDLLDVTEGPSGREAAAGEMALGGAGAQAAMSDSRSPVSPGPPSRTAMPVGTLCIGLAIGEQLHTTTAHLPGQREQMRQMSSSPRSCRWPATTNSG